MPQIDQQALKTCIKNLELAAQFQLDADFACFEKQGLQEFQRRVRIAMRYTTDLLKDLREQEGQ